MLLSRFAWLMLVVGVLCTRGLTPEGWMPVANAAGGIEFALCDGMGPIEPAASMSMVHGKMHHKAPAKGQPGNHPCTGAGINFADMTPPLPAIVAPLRPTASALVSERATIAPGRGLAAPPPPATGPPALA
ncbi:MAG: hypothetical protein ABIR08_03400 [Sphingomonas sp.]